MKNTNVLCLIEEALKTNGFGGLQCDGECSCKITDLAPCGEIKTNCEAGYIVYPPNTDGYDFYICHSKDDRPWE